MAGKHVSQAYIARICDYGIGRVFERVENGETIKSIAVSLGMSRAFLSTFLNKDHVSAELLALCRVVAAHRRLAAHPEGEGRPEARNYSTNGPAIHLEALGLISRRTVSVMSVGPPAVVARTTHHEAFLAAFQASRPVVPSEGTGDPTSVIGRRGL